MSEERKPFWLKCIKCGHCWALCYMPIAVQLLAKIAKGNKLCPMCGAGKPVIAKQDNGKLLEAGRDGATRGGGT